MGHGCFVKHPFKSSCVEFQEYKYNHMYALPIQTKHLLLMVARNPSSFLTFIFQRNLQRNFLSVDLSRRILDSHQRYMKGTWLKITIATWPTSHFFVHHSLTKKNGTPPKSNIQRPKIAICLWKEIHFPRPINSSNFGGHIYVYI